MAVYFTTGNAFGENYKFNLSSEYKNSMKVKNNFKLFLNLPCINSSILSEVYALLKIKLRSLKIWKFIQILSNILKERFSEPKHQLLCFIIIVRVFFKG